MNKVKHKKKYIALLKEVQVNAAKTGFTGVVDEPFAEAVRLNITKGTLVNTIYCGEHEIGDGITAIESLYQNYQVIGGITYE